MSDPTTRLVLAKVIEAIDIPDSSYELTERRYRDLADWFGRPDARCAVFQPHLHPQGSFRLGTVIRPLNENDEYDLDMGCRLRVGVSKTTHTQKQVKHLVGDDLEDYRVARNIKEGREEKHRCWRLRYADTLCFHMDVVPSIPEIEASQQLLREAMVKTGSSTLLAESVSKHAGVITDNRSANYEVISDAWRVSNSEGFALWFESQMELSRTLLEKWASAARAAKVDKLPSYLRKSPLQRCVQLLKRHRDVMFKDNPDGKPISAIITTLAARAYQGEAEIDVALSNILDRMGGFVRHNAPYVPNPVSLTEDFADKWYQPEYRHLRLEENFRQWLAQAQLDVAAIRNTRSQDVIARTLRSAFDVIVGAEVLADMPGLLAGQVIPKSQILPSTAARPWGAPA